MPATCQAVFWSREKLEQSLALEEPAVRWERPAGSNEMCTMAGRECCKENPESGGLGAAVSDHSQRAGEPGSKVTDEQTPE